MLIFTKTKALQAYLSEVRAKELPLGFVPTMGALHQGHISLIEASKQQCKVTICSIFVNPRQFNDQNDLKSYPRMPEKDTELLKKAGCDLLFLPTIEEIYLDDVKEKFDFGDLDKLLEARFRPGHFDGVAQVLKRFFEIIQPQKAFFGIKDYQQVLIVKALIKQLNSPIQVVSCPILREKDGLAMSSRNALLQLEERKTAALIPIFMKKAVQLFKTSGNDTARAFIINEVSRVPLMKLDYFEICDADSLKPLTHYSEHSNAVALIALFVGKIRLIDNLSLNS